MAKATRGRRSVEAEAFSGPPTFLQGLTADERKLVLQAAESRRYKAGHIITSAGELPASLFLLMKGSVKYYQITKKGEEVLLWWATRGNIFGVGALLTPPIRTIGTAEAVGDCEVLVWSRKKLLQVTAATQHLLVENALRMALYYLIIYSDRMVGLATEDAGKRVARSLLRLGQRMGHMGPNGVELAITNEHLGAVANVNAFTVSRHLRKLQRQGVICKGRGKILVHSPEHLLSD